VTPLVTPFVTGVRDLGKGRVSVELDGEPWRVLPADAVVRSGLNVGVAIDRPRARLVRTELRRSEALAIATRSLRFRDHSRQSLSDRLSRSRVDAATGDEALDTLERLGLVDDSRSASARATALAERDAGDLFIQADLEQRGFAPADIAAAIDALDPETTRAERIVEQRGASPRTIRRLLAKGFSPEAIEGLIADAELHELG
jgi:SOS response regulatory protein OraA/RecX